MGAASALNQLSKLAGEQDKLTGGEEIEAREVVAQLSHEFAPLLSESLEKNMLKTLNKGLVPNSQQEGLGSSNQSCESWKLLPPKV